MSDLDDNIIIEEDDDSVDGFLPGDMPTETQIGTYQAQFENIRNMVCAELQSCAAEYTMSVQKLVRTCINANLEIANLAEQHCQNILQRFKACHAKLVNHTTNNAMYDIDGKMLLVDFDLSSAEHSIIGARFMKPSVFDSQLSVASELLLLKQLQVLLVEPIDDNAIIVPYNQLRNSMSMARKQLNRSREVLQALIQSRAFTAFDFKPGLSLYTLNFSEDLSMLFWDRYTIIETTMKSYYIEQHCIVEHTITGDVEPERFIDLHKPSKNSVAQFLADRLTCLIDLVRPAATIAATQPDAVREEITEDDEEFSDEDLIEMGMSVEEIQEYRASREYGDTVNDKPSDSLDSELAEELPKPEISDED